MILVKVSRDFTMTPGGRFRKEGPFSGEEFRDNILVSKYREAVEKDEILIVDLDDCRRAYPPSFLDEAFGGLAKLIGDKDIISKLKIVSNDEPKLVEDIKKYIKKNME